MNIGLKGLALIKSFEGCKLDSYQDSVGVWTCGYGTTGPDIVEGITFTQAQAERRLMDSLDSVEQCVERHVTATLTQNQFDALCAFVYNVGCVAFSGSTMLKKVEAGDFVQAAQEFQRWNRAGGNVLAGLTRRRTAEARLFVTPDA